MAAACGFHGCPEPAVARCECYACAMPFCEDHGSRGGDLTRGGIDIAYPSRCFGCGGYNADA